MYLDLTSVACVKYLVSLNGELQKGAVAADDQEDYIIRYSEREGDKYDPCPWSLYKEQVYGEVAFWSLDLGDTVVNDVVPINVNEIFTTGKKRVKYAGHDNLYWVQSNIKKDKSTTISADYFVYCRGDAYQFMPRNSDLSYPSCLTWSTMRTLLSDSTESRIALANIALREECEKVVVKDCIGTMQWLSQLSFVCKRLC